MCRVVRERVVTMVITGKVVTNIVQIVSSSALKGGGGTLITIYRIV